MKRDAKTAFKKMSTAKREAFLREIKEDAGEEDEPFPPNNIKAVRNLLCNMPPFHSLP